MSVESLATGLSQAKLATDVGYAVQRQALRSERQTGQALIALIDDAAKIGKSGGSDAYSTAATGKGSVLDVYG